MTTMSADRRSELASWMRAYDLSLAWQVERDLLHLPKEQWQKTRAQSGSGGFAARLLAAQDPAGTWAGGAYFPAGEANAAADASENVDAHAGQPWTATTWTLTTLREWGVDASLLKDTADKLRATCRWEYDDLPYWSGEVDTCINAMTLANAAWLGVATTSLRKFLLTHRAVDGGWNCAWYEEPDHTEFRSSFHSTLTVVRMLLAYEELTGDTSVRRARHDGEEYLLQRGLMRRQSTGERIADWATRLIYPFRGYYSLSGALAHFTDAARVDGTAFDERMSDAIALLRERQRPDGTWLQEGRDRGAVWFEVDAATGEPSPWLTFYGLRALEKWDAEHPALTATA